MYNLADINDYSRFSWVFFLATKDETAFVLKTFIVGLENLLSLKVKIIRCDNGTEFKNTDLNQFGGLKGIKREFSVPRTPRQNGIAERKNKTLIEAARTLLADSLLLIPFWAKAVNTACYVQNRVLVTKPHNKTPYELLHGRLPSIGFIRPLAVLKAFRVFNSRTRIVQETLHVNFMENKPNVAGSGPAWQFDIDSLSQTMNYHPVLAENQSNPIVGFQDTEKAGEEGNQTYVLFPVLSDGSTNPKNNKDAHTGGNKHNDDIQNAENQSNNHAGFQDTKKAEEEETQTYVLFPVLSDGSTNSQNNNKDAHANGKEHDDDIQKSVSPDFHSSSCGDQTRKQGDKTENKDKGFRDLNEEFAECINNSSNGGSAAGPSNAAMPNLEDLS
nr:hypothetical protein [Tanacetum cinerariifolium]